VADDTVYAIVAHENITERKLAEDRVREQERMLRCIYDSAPMVTGIVERVEDDLLHISGNVDAAQYFGITQEELRNQFTSDLGLPPDELAMWVQRCRESEATGQSLRFVFQSDVSGEVLWLAGTVCFIAQMPDGHPRFAYMVQDITEQTKIEQELRLFSTIMNESPSGIVILDHRERILYANPAYERLSGYTLQELRGRRPGTVLQGDRADRKQQRSIRESLRARKPLSIELLNYYKSGDPYWIEMHIAPVFNEADEVTHFVAVVNDINQRKRVEEEARRSEEQMEEAQRIAHIGSWEFDFATQSAVWSKELFRLHNRDPEQGSPGYEDYLALFLPDDIVRLQKLIEHTRKTGVGYEVDVQGIRSDGSIHWFHLTDTTFIGEDGNMIRVAGTHHDITQRKAAEQELERLHNRLRKAREAETAVSARIQHLLLAPTIPQNLPGVHIAALSLPSQLVDGDFSDFVVHSDTLFDLVMGDVMGKGLSTALLGAASKSLILRNFIYLLGSNTQAGMPSPEALIRQVHRTSTPRLLQLGTFIAAVYARFDLTQREALLVDCGHASPIHYQQETDTCRFVLGQGLPLGVSASEVYQQTRIPFTSGDLFVFYSNGITEARSPMGEMYGAERLLELMQAHRRETPSQLIAALHRSLVEFTTHQAFTDDVTCIIIKINRY
jgi:sigma-B regulation protein RsbU (phosphoserine phosphatase)